MGSEGGTRFTATLARRAGEDASAAKIADGVVGIWTEIDHAMRPIIGQRGVAALYQRSLQVTGARYAWLADRYDGIQALMELAPLGAALAEQSSDDAFSAGAALLETFYELVSKLVGPSLAARLLRSVLLNDPAEPPVQDPSP